MKLIPLFLTVAGCSPTFSPLVRGAHYGAPGRLEAGRVEVGGTAGGYAVPDVGGPRVGFGIKDWVALEAGGNISALEYPSVTGYIGPRFSLVPHRDRPIHLISDLELGFGGGIGGYLKGNQQPSRDCTACDGRSWSDRVALGGYAGLGVGVQIRWFSLYARARLEVSSATNVPVTYWPSVVGGMDFNIKRRAAINVLVGYLGYYNETDSTRGIMYQIGVTLFFDAFGPARRSASPAPAPLVPLPPVVAPPPRDPCEGQPQPEPEPEAEPEPELEETEG